MGRSAGPDTSTRLRSFVYRYRITYTSSATDSVNWNMHFTVNQMFAARNGITLNLRCTFWLVNKEGDNSPGHLDCHLDSNRPDIQIPSVFVLSAGYRRHLSDNWVI